MEEPRLLVNSSPDGAEQAEIRCTEIVNLLWPSKPKARAFQVAHRIFLNMAGVRPWHQAHAFGMVLVRCELPST